MTSRKIIPTINGDTVHWYIFIGVSGFGELLVFRGNIFISYINLKILETRILCTLDLFITLRWQIVWLPINIFFRVFPWRQRNCEFIYWPADARFNSSMENTVRWKRIRVAARHKRVHSRSERINIPSRELIFHPSKRRCVSAKNSNGRWGHACCVCVCLQMKSLAFSES